MVVPVKLLILTQFEPEFKHYRAEYFLDAEGKLRADTEVFHLPALTSLLFLCARMELLVQLPACARLMRLQRSQLYFLINDSAVARS
ncbi:MAG: hypothetical protein LBP35_02485 [Candidatus Ancillula trichonymphae]|jgi:hypothetical protein|nr:hypothetical protein [Candidatus Ancillula trichonymphae]